mmetsp:Transcript_137581/g.439617  ORF Transcript_137581/g.439617 Transcript_137581/m.439617 type:complete len:423 (-) Transcript_137581:129-1397(-)|eukprot:CAMPEP_0203912338 /NCGR_PEP_ID=MMETSP0359-20131031/53425_1 /ASSEMBLY_ACC=CAM_ASM_000338 /TAXON_ID=268821 /ORGANISM="Scrippsiella Hangoei, Strain SHTV-5" /LENGTH=422 /DNA_ID=CAMNT_0050838255 /DNA_START=29 /DNA_END=1297 /DNA_ORIENTATION=+
MAAFAAASAASFAPVSSAAPPAARPQLPARSCKSPSAVPVTAVVAAAGLVVVRQHRGRGRISGRRSSAGVSSRRVAMTLVAEAPAAATEAGLSFEEDHDGLRRIQYNKDGWSRWTWQGVEGTGPFDCHYVAAGPVTGPPIVLVHGFGASAYHWRYQIPALVEQGYRVYAICLIGFGWSPRVQMRYTGELWAAQLNAFLQDVVGGPAVLVGNSIGAFVSLIAASSKPEFARALVLLNAAGRFEGGRSGAQQVDDSVAAAAEQAEPGPMQWALQQVARTFAAWAFFTTKLRIGSILEWVYENKAQVDEQLIESIRSPADHPDALDTFGEVIRAGSRTEVTVFDALDRLPTSTPLLLLWGSKDPWMRVERASAIRAECAQRKLSCDYVPIDAGHCPQDDAPALVNGELLSWLRAKGFASDVEVSK